jgi:hypothetical protein
VGNLFTGDFIPPDISFEIPRSKYTDTITPAPEGCVRDNNGGLRSDVFWQGNNLIIQFVSHPPGSSRVFLSKFSERLFAMSIVMPQTGSQNLFSLFVLKTISA